MSYLGNSVTRDGLLPGPSLLLVIRKIPTSQNVKELRSFLRLAGYYHSHVKDFAAIASPLHSLTKKAAVYHWTLKCQDTFVQLKLSVNTCNHHGIPLLWLTFSALNRCLDSWLGCNFSASSGGMRAHYLLLFPLSVTEKKNYPAIKLECLAIVWATAKLCSYLMANEFDICTDHYAVQWLKSMRTGSALLHRWSAELEEFDVTVHHRPSKAQTHVDWLNLLPVEQVIPEGEEATLIIQSLAAEEGARWVGQGPHNGTHMGVDAIWELFQDHFTYTGGKRI